MNLSADRMGKEPFIMREKGTGTGREGEDTYDLYGQCGDNDTETG